MTPSSPVHCHPLPSGVTIQIHTAQSTTDTNPMTHPRKQTIYCAVPLEFIQPWDYAKCIRTIQELNLGNATWLSIAFHVGNSAVERRLWKKAFPGLSALIDATPRFKARPRHGMARI